MKTKKRSKGNADTRRLNWLEQQNACLRYDAEDDASLPQAVVFLPTLESGQDRGTFRVAGHGDTFREAIDDAIRKEKCDTCGGSGKVVWPGGPFEACEVCNRNEHRTRIHQQSK